MAFENTGSAIHASMMCAALRAVSLSSMMSRSWMEARSCTPNVRPVSSAANAINVIVTRVMGRM